MRGVRCCLLSLVIHSWASPANQALIGGPLLLVCVWMRARLLTVRSLILPKTKLTLFVAKQRRWNEFEVVRRIRISIAISVNSYTGMSTEASAAANKCFEIDILGQNRTGQNYQSYATTTAEQCHASAYLASLAVYRYLITRVWIQSQQKWEPIWTFWHNLICIKSPPFLHKIINVGSSNVTPRLLERESAEALDKTVD